MCALEVIWCVANSWLCRTAFRDSGKNGLLRRLRLRKMVALLFGAEAIHSRIGPGWRSAWASMSEALSAIVHKAHSFDTPHVLVWQGSISELCPVYRHCSILWENFSREESGEPYSCRTAVVLEAVDGPPPYRFLEQFLREVQSRALLPGGYRETPPVRAYSKE